MANGLWIPNRSIQDNDVSRSNQVGVYLPVTAVFPGTEPSIDALKSLLSSLSRTDALFWSARLNLIVSNASYHDQMNKQLYGLHNFFSKQELHNVAEFMAEHAGPPTVFFRGQLLELMRWICRFSQDLPGDGSTFNNAETRRTFAKAALIVSDLWGWRTWQDRMRLDDGIEAARRRSLGAVRVAHDADTCGVDPMMAIGRGRLLFLDHLSQIRQSFPDEFRAQTGLTPEDFFGLLCIIAVHYLDRTPEKAIESTDKSGIFLIKHFLEKNAKLASVSEIYFARASQTANELAEAFWPAGEQVTSCSLAWRDLGAIRDRPVLRAADGRAIILDPVFFAESAAVGPLFTILAGDRKKGEVILTQFGHAFESYTSSILRRMYPLPKGNIADRLTCNVVGRDKAGNEVQISDACLNNADEVVLFETKATWIRDDIVEHPDPNEYIRVLRERYSRRADGQPKGAGQLANAIANLALCAWRPTNQDFSLARRIYPVLLTYDSRLDGVSHSHFLAEEFRLGLRPDEVHENGEMCKGRFVVTPLIVLTIDDLEILERSVENFGLVELLKDYSQSSPDRMMSVRNYIAFSDYGKKLFASGSLAESVLKTLDVAKHMMSAGR